jgi:uncharacterized protein with FMN-binding domain
VRTRAALGSIFGSIAVLVIGWQAGAAAATAHSASASAAITTSGSTSGTTTPSTPSGSTSSTAPSTSSGTKTSTSTGSKTYTGASADTPFGTVQVKITVASGKLTDVTAVHLTDNGGRSVEISNYAAPILRTEVLAAQSANVSSVGGATYTSQGYLTSLQSALDQAGLK